MASSSATGFDKLRIIRALDQLLWPLVLGLAKILRRIPRRRSSTVAIVRPGGMGDLICLHMAVLRVGQDPRDFVWIIERRSSPWAELMQLPYRVISPRLILDLGRFGSVINTEQHYGISQIIAISLVGKGMKVTSFSTVRGARSSEIICPYNPVRTHEVLSFSALLEAALTLDRTTSDYVPPLVEDRCGLVVALGGGHAHSRSLTVEQWSDVIKKWAGGRKFSLVSGPVETDLARELQGLFHSTATYRPGNFSDNCSMIRRAERVLTVDGGLTHVASFFGTPTDTIFTSGQTQLWAPLGKGSRIFVDESVECRPCTMFGHTPACQVNYLCKSRLSEIVQESL